MRYTVSRNVDVPMRDGTLLRADLWLPEAAPAAAILFRTPYDKSQLNPDLLKPQQCVEAGFAAVVQDTRGRFASQGQWRPTMWQQESLDTYDTVEWVAGQSWCTRAVGMSGPSYLAITQLVGALQRPPHLKAIAPAMASAPEFERLETGGALRLDHIMSWVSFMALEWIQKRAASGNPPTAEQMGLVLAAAHDPGMLNACRPLKNVPLFKLPGFPITFDELMKDLFEPDEIDAAQIDIPTFHVGGWYDIFTRSTLGMHRKQVAAGNPTSHVLMGCWSHSGPLPQYHGQVNFGLFAGAAAARVKDYHLAFFRRYLLNDKVPLPRVRYFVMNANTWHDAETWPPAGTTQRRMYLRGSDEPNRGHLSDEMPSSQDDSISYTYDPSDPTPTLGGRVLYVGRLAMGPIDQHSIHARKDVVLYRSAPFSAALTLLGPQSVDLHVSSTRPDTDFVVKLLDIDGTGVSLPVCEGVVRMRWRRGFDRELPIRPGEVEKISVSLGDTAWRVEAGHALAVQVQSANYPHLDPNMNTGRRLGEDAEGAPATNRVFHDRERPSALELTVHG